MNEGEASGATPVPGETGDDAVLTSAQRWSQRARHVIDQNGRDAFDAMLAADFVQESRRGDAFEFDRAALLGLYDTMKEFDFEIGGVDVAIAGDLHLLTRRAYIGPQSTSELLAVSAWNADGQLQRLVEFELDDIDAALAELGRLSGEPVVEVTPGS